MRVLVLQVHDNFVLLLLWREVNLLLEEVPAKHQQAFSMELLFLLCYASHRLNQLFMDCSKLVKLDLKDFDMGLGYNLVEVVRLLICVQG